MSVLTGHKDSDIIILSKLDDRSLLNLCLVRNRYINTLCNNEDFWRNRFVKVFGLEASKYKPEDRTWKKHYLTVIMHLDELLLSDGDIAGDPFKFFSNFVQGEINSDNFYNEVNKSISTLPKIYQTGYWLLNLGNEIKIAYQIDRYDELPPIVREYSADTYFTPAKIVKIISDFYNETITAEELLEQQQVDNPYAAGLTVIDAKNNLIQRKHLVGMFFEGLDPYDGVYHVIFGS